MRPGKIDRSPTGTGCSALMAVLHAKGRLGVGRRYTGRSIIETRFDCRIVEETQLAGRSAIVPEISGRAWITGTQQRMLDQGIPFRKATGSPTPGPQFGRVIRELEFGVSQAKR